ncbi:MAG: NAD(P)H-hydrate epimerase [bacterium]
MKSGKGNNGADGIAAARHFQNRGHKTDIVLAEPLKFFKIYTAKII